MSGLRGPTSLNADAYLWVGASGGVWGAPGNWSDTTSLVTPALYVPGTLTPVTITGPTGSTFEVITGGGVAASLAETGNVNLAGSYAVGSAVTVGSQVVTAGPYNSGTVALTAGALTLATGGTITAASVNLLDGTISVGPSASMIVGGSLSAGLPNGNYTPYNTTYAYSSGATATINVAAGATLSTTGSLLLNSATLSDAGGVVSIGGALMVGTAGTPSSTTPFSYGAVGQVIVTVGGTLTVAGAITDPVGILVASGAGSKLITTGTLTASIGGSYISSIGSLAGSVAAISGGNVQIGGFVINDRDPAVFISGAAIYTPGLFVDLISSVEVGSVGGSAIGAITVDAGKIITANTTSTISGALVDNGTVVVTSGTLTQTGSVTGAGAVQIGKNATFQINGTVAATDTISFLDTAAALSIGSFSSFNGTTSASNSYAIGATITGFQTGDSIIVAQPVSTAIYIPAAGTLVLSNGTSTIETLHLAGDFTGNLSSSAPQPTAEQRSAWSPASSLAARRRSSCRSHRTQASRATVLPAPRC